MIIYLFISNRKKVEKKRERWGRGRQSFLKERSQQMLSHTEDRKGTKDGRGYPALSTRDFVVNNASSWRRTRRSESWQSVRSGWPLAISLTLFPSLPCYPLSLPRRTLLPPSVSRSLLPCPYLSPEPVAHKLIRSRCLLARDSHWPPQSRRSPCSLRRSPPAPPAPHGTETTLFLVPPWSQIFAKVT